MIYYLRSSVNPVLSPEINSTWRALCALSLLDAIDNYDKQIQSLHPLLLKSLWKVEAKIHMSPIRQCLAQNGPPIFIVRTPYLVAENTIRMSIVKMATLVEVRRLRNDLILPQV